MNTTCNKCPYCEIKCEYHTKLENAKVSYICNKTNEVLAGPTMFLDIACYPSSKCPLKITANNAPEVDPIFKLDKGEPIRKGSSQWYSAWNAIPRFIPWDEIKENTIYHIPPIFDEKRKDVLVTKKYDSILHVRVLAENNVPLPDNGRFDTIYYNSGSAKRMTPNLLKKL